MPIRVNTYSDTIRVAVGDYDPLLYSYCFWYETVVNDTGQNRWLSVPVDSGGNARHAIFIDNADDNLKMNNAFTLNQFSANPATSGWVFLAQSCNGAGAGARKGYVWNLAALGGSPTGTATGTGDGTAVTQWLLGSNDYDRYLNGRFCGFKRWNAELSQAEFAIEMTQLDAVRTANLKAVNRIQNNTDTSDASGNGNTLTLGGTMETEGTEPVPWQAGGLLLLQDLKLHGGLRMRNL
jgi:hypothetical protein